MGYSTDFFGHFNLSKKLTKDQSDYLHLFSRSRHFEIDVSMVKQSDLMKRLDISIGKEGCFYIGQTIYNINYGLPYTINYNKPPADCPGLWCDWIPTEDNCGIQWGGGEKFYNYTEWLNFIITHFLKKWDIEISGNVRFQGEDISDFGFLRIKNGVAIKDISNNCFE